MEAIKKADFTLKIDVSCRRCCQAYCFVCFFLCIMSAVLSTLFVYEHIMHESVVVDTTKLLLFGYMDKQVMSCFDQSTINNTLPDTVNVFF